MHRSNEPTPPSFEALALLEIDGLPRAIRAHDGALKRAAIESLGCTPVTPGKALLLFGGLLANVEESFAVAREIAGNRLIDALLLSSVHPGVVRALTHTFEAKAAQALAIFELATVASTLASADGALKSAEVELTRMHLATGYGGKGFCTLAGAQADVEAAVEAASLIAGAKLLDVEVIAAPHDDLAQALFRRLWDLDPSATPR